jgi:hypothetical protein
LTVVEALWAENGTTGIRNTGKLSLACPGGIVCPARSVNLLLKMVSVHSRASPEAADTVFDP